MKDTMITIWTGIKDLGKLKNTKENQPKNHQGNQTEYVPENYHPKEDHQRMLILKNQLKAQKCRQIILNS